MDVQCQRGAAAPSVWPAGVAIRMANGARPGRAYLHDYVDVIKVPEVAKFL